MVDGADNRGEPTKPISSITPKRPGEETVRLDRSIVFSDPSLPARFGRYEVLSRIGVGGFASVYSALDPELESPVAIKVLAENHSADVEVRRRFVAEARVARRLGSDRLIGVFDLGETDDGRPYVVMELADRGTLRARVAKLSRPSVSSIVRLVEELGACMTAIHAKGVVHRDIKPSNLLLRSTGRRSTEPPTELIATDERLLLADFGLARDISGGASAVTVGGGTAGYMAPEQADPEGGADHRADIYAATVVVAEMATGRHPERLDLRTATLPPAVIDAVEQSLAMDRHMRPQTAAIWQEGLLAAFSNDSPTSLIRPGTDLNQTGRLDPTRIHAPYPHGDTVYPHGDTLDSEVLIPPPPQAPQDPDRRAAASPPDDQPPPPPPSIPINPRFQRPPPPRTPAGQQAGRPAAPPAGQSAIGRRADSPPATPERANGNGQAGPAPPRHPASSATPGNPVGDATLKPPTPRPPPPVIGPGGELLQPAKATRPPAPAPSPRPAPPTTAPPPDPAQRYNPVAASPPLPMIAPAAPVPAQQLGGGTSSSGRVAEQRSKEHLRTAKRLAKLNQKASRRKARQVRRRRRILRIANFFLRLIRGGLSSTLTFILGSAFIASRSDSSYVLVSSNPRPALLVVVVMAFFVGMAYFPWPRLYDYD